MQQALRYSCIPIDFEFGAGYTRIVLPELCIVESKPDNALHDLRLPAPFPELAALRERVDVDAEVPPHLVVSVCRCYS